MNNNEVKFVSTVKGVPDMFPIKPMSEYKPDWVKKAREDYKKLDKTRKLTHITLCPAIFELFKFGWYVPMWYDVYITTGKDKRGFSWRVADTGMTRLSEVNIIETHTDRITKFIPKRKDRIDHIVKINTPYRIIAPKNIKFLFLPMPYPDHFDYECSSGLLDPAVNSEVNVQLYWNIKEGDRFIKAGSPLMQIVPITDKDLTMVCREANEREMNWVKKKPYFSSFSISPIRNKIKESYHKYFNKS